MITLLRARPDVSGAHRAPARPTRVLGLTPLELVFVVASGLAPLSLFLLRSLTAYDVVIAAVAFLLVTGRGGLEPLPRPLAVSGWLFLLAALVSSVRATFPVEAFTQTAQFAFAWFVLLPVVLTMARRPRVLRAALTAVVLGATATLVLAMTSPVASGAGRFLVFFTDNPNRLGYPSAYLSPFVAHAVVRLWQRGLRLPAVGLALGAGYLALWALGASGSRGATIALLVAVVVYAILRPDVALRAVVERLVLAALGVVALALLLTRSGLFPLTLVDRVSRTFDASQRPDLLQDRESLALAGLRAFADSPFVGTGLDNFRYLAPRYAGDATLQAPHNLWIQFLAQVGIVGALAFAWFVVWWFATLVAAHRRSTDRAERDLLWAFVASTAAVMTFHMTTPIITDRHYWLLLGLGLALAASAGREAGEHDTGEHDTGERDDSERDDGDRDDSDRATTPTAGDRT